MEFHTHLQFAIWFSFKCEFIMFKANIANDLGESIFLREGMGVFSIFNELRPTQTLFYIMHDGSLLYALMFLFDEKKIFTS